jgi:Flp pilus assembly protein TadG
MSWKMRLSTLRHRLRKYSRSGSAALEFAFVAPVFFFLMVGILQLGIMTFGQFALQNAVTEASRLVRTGQAQSIDATQPTPQCSGSTTQVTYGTQQKWFNGQVCCGVTPLLDCTKLQVTVAPSTGFGGSYASYVDSGDPANPSPANYNPGTACNVVLVRATYAFPIWFPGMASLLNGNWTFADVAGGTVHTIAGTSAFRNEPFTAAVNGC